MSIVSLVNVTVLNNPARFMDPYEFEITFECLEPLQDDLEWKLVYVGASKSSKYDQELDSLLVGPVPQGVNRFIFQTDPPKPDLIPQDQLVSITVMLLSCAYRGRDFVQVGYYVNNEYDDEELRENPPNRVALDHVVRNILAEKPRVTKYNIPWDSEERDEYPPEQPDVDDEAEEDYGNDEDDLRDEMIDELEAGDVEVDGEAEDEEDDVTAEFQQEEANEAEAEAPNADTPIAETASAETPNAETPSAETPNPEAPNAEIPVAEPSNEAESETQKGSAEPIDETSKAAS